MANNVINGVLIERLKMVEDYVSDLREVQQLTFKEYQTEKYLRRFIERTLHTAIEACLDIGRRLISQAGFRYPTDNKDVFVVLIEEGVLPDSQRDPLQAMAGFRNVLVHQYADLDDLAVYGAFKKRLGDFENFATSVQEYLVKVACHD